MLQYVLGENNDKCFFQQYEHKIKEIKKRKVAISVSLDGVKIKLRQKKKVSNNSHVFIFIYVQIAGVICKTLVSENKVKFVVLPVAYPIYYC